MPSPRADHLVQFYERDEFLIDELARFFGPALRDGAAGVVIATPLHRAMLEARLAAEGVPTGALLDRDAAATLATFMVGSSPEPTRFRATIREVLEEARRRGNGKVLAFGEMVALLWEEGNTLGALDLEELWNELQASEEFDLLCAYPMRSFGESGHGNLFDAVMDTHGQVRPTESYLALVGEEALRREVARLQQRAAVLAAEVERRRAAQKELEGIAAKKDEFIAMLAHELRNPLTPLVLGLELAADQVPGNPQLDRARKHALLLVRLVDDLLDVSRLTRGKVEIRRAQVPLAAVVAQALEVARPLLRERGHEVRVEVPEDCILDADGDRLTQAFGNLLQNAAKYTPAGGSIHVRARVEGHEVVVEVADSGQGFGEDVAHNLFRPFAQADPARGGLGLGLAVVRTIVELHGGSVQGSSPGPGRGSTFTVRLPLPMARYQDLQTPSPLRAQAGHQRRVLVVDDSEDIAWAVAEVLRIDGHDVRTALDGPSALDIAAAWSPEVVLCDLSMDGMDGYELARRFRAMPRMEGAVLVALSGYAQEADRSRSREAGFDHHLAKPPESRALLRLVRGAQRADPLRSS